MRTRIGIAVLLFMMIQGVLFGIGAVLVLASPLSEMAMELFPWVVLGSCAIAAPLSWWLAPRLRVRYWNDRERYTTSDKVIADLS